MKKIYNKTAAIIILVIAAVITIGVWFHPNTVLVLKNTHTGDVWAEYPLKEGQEFSVQFIHSVNQSPVEDFYRVINNKIYVTKTIYYHFGAGVQTEILEGQTLSYAEDGAMVVSGIDTYLPQLSYMVGTWSDHILRIGTEEISLRDTCGKSSLVTFSFERKGVF